MKPKRVFLEIARATDQNGISIILQEDKTKYIVIAYEELVAEQQHQNEDINAIARRISNKSQISKDRISAVKKAAEVIDKIDEVMRTVNIRPYSEVQKSLQEATRKTIEVAGLNRSNDLTLNEIFKDYTGDFKCSEEDSSLVGKERFWEEEKPESNK